MVKKIIVIGLLAISTSIMPRTQFEINKLLKSGMLFDKDTLNNTIDYLNSLKNASFDLYLITSITKESGFDKGSAGFQWISKKDSAAGSNIMVVVKTGTNAPTNNDRIFLGALGAFRKKLDSCKHAAYLSVAQVEKTGDIVIGCTFKAKKGFHAHDAIMLFDSTAQ